MNQNTWQPVTDEQTLRDLYVGKNKTQREIADLLGCSLKPIQTAMRKFGIQPRPQIKRDQTGPKNASWKGQDAGYHALHLRVEAQRGKPSWCEVCGTTNAKRFEWANQTGNYADPADYKRMCCSCHRLFDNARRAQ